MEESAMDANEFALNETNETGNNAKDTSSQQSGVKDDRRFGVEDIWKIRRGARNFKIHSRVPRI